MQVTGRAAPFPDWLGPDSWGHRGWDRGLHCLCREAGGGEGSIRRPPRHSPRCELHQRSPPSPSGRCCVPGDSIARGMEAGLAPAGEVTAPHRPSEARQGGETKARRRHGGPHGRGHRKRLLPVDCHPAPSWMHSRSMRDWPMTPRRGRYTATE